MNVSSSLDSEIDIELTDEEISALQKGVVRGVLKVRGVKPHKIFGARNVEILVGRINESSLALYIEQRTFPLHAGFEDIEKYGFILSSEGYEILKEKGRVVGRTGGPGKVCIYRTGHWIFD